MSVAKKAELGGIFSIFLTPKIAGCVTTFATDPRTYFDVLTDSSSPGIMSGQCFSRPSATSTTLSLTLTQSLYNDVCASIAVPSINCLSECYVRSQTRANFRSIFSVLISISRSVKLSFAASLISIDSCVQSFIVCKHNGKYSISRSSYAILCYIMLCYVKLCCVMLLRYYFMYMYVVTTVNF